MCQQRTRTILIKLQANETPSTRKPSTAVGVNTCKHEYSSLRVSLTLKVPLHILYRRDNERERGGWTYLDPFQYLGCDFLSLALPTEIWGEDCSIPNHPIYSGFDALRSFHITEVTEHQRRRTN